MIQFTLFLAPMAALAASSQTLATCDVLYQNRPSALVVALDCYREVSELAKLNGDVKTRREALEKFAEGKVWFALHSQQKSDRLNQIHEGKAAAESLISEYAQASSGYYWRAVYLSQEVREKDEGALIPRETLRAVPQIKKDLLKAIQLGPEVHGYGPNRVYGIIYASMPALVGGDKKIGEENMRKAYTGAPRFSANALELGKFYQSEKRSADARSILKELIQLDPHQFDASRIPETRDDQAAAQKIWNALP